jgi:hypothetical protein
MVYLAGDNDLDGAASADLVEMKKVGSTRDISVVAQFDRSGSKRLNEPIRPAAGDALAEDVVTALGEDETPATPPSSATS